MRLAFQVNRSERRILILFLVALLVLAAAIANRLISDSFSDHQSLAIETTTRDFSTEATILRFQERLRRNPEDTYAYAQLGLSLLQRVRETADASLYGQAEEAFSQALSRDPDQLDAVIGQGILALARHDFAGALAWGQRARAINPFRAEILGIMVDSQIELGRYPEALETGQAMVDLRPDLTSYSRVSYLRELHGNGEGAIEAMRLAADAGPPGLEATLWTQTQLGHLYFNRGELEQAADVYREALRWQPDYVYAQAGLARLQAARGDLGSAIEAYESIVQRLPAPEFVIALGELYEVTGQPEKAMTQYDLVRAMQQLNAAAGVDVDLELALFNADHGADSAQALENARAAYARRPSIFAADVLAWTLYQNGNYAEAGRFSQEALRLGTRDALLHYHAGRIAYALGNEAEARAQLEEAMAINPYFSLRYAPDAQTLLAELSSP